MSVFVICHDSPPAFQLPSGAKIVWLNKASFPWDSHLEVINGYDYFKNPEDIHDKLSGAMGSIVISRYLSERSERPSHVTIWQYRKFLSKKPYGVVAPNYPSMLLVNMKDAAKIRPEVCLSDNADYTFSVPLDVNNTLAQYSNHHNVIDFIKYSCCLFDENVIEQKEIVSFFHGQYMIPGGIELGTYPTEWWLETMKSIERATLCFLDKHTLFDSGLPYQKRAVAFCQERIGSYLLIKKVKEIYGLSVPGSLLGIMHTVTNLSAYASGDYEKELNHKKNE